MKLEATTQQQARKKVLFLITKSVWGGAQKYVHDLATGLPKDAFETAVALGGNGVLKEKLEAAGVRTISIPRLGRDISIADEIAVLISLVKLLLAERPDVIHVNSSKIGGLGAAVGRAYNAFMLMQGFFQSFRSSASKLSFEAELRPVHIVFTAHGFAWNEPRPAWQRSLIVFFTWLTLLLAHRTIVISKREERQASKLPFVKRRLRLIYNGISEPAFMAREKARRDLAERIGRPFPAEAFVIGTIAELYNHLKGLDAGVEAIRILEDRSPGRYAWIVIGEGESRAELERRIAANGLSERIFLPGGFPDAASHLAAFDLFLLPSRKEGLPYTLIEAGFAGLPAISTPVGGIPELIENGVSGLLADPGDAAGIAAAIGRVAGGGSFRERLAAEHAGRMRKGFGIGKMLGETAALYRKKLR